MDLREALTNENVGGWDLMVRALAGTVAVTALALDMVPGQWRWLAALIAFLGLFSATTRHCTPYNLLGVNTAETG